MGRHYSIGIHLAGEAGTLRLVGINEEVIYRNFKELLEDKEAYDKMTHACNPYGDGHACKRIADILEYGTYEIWIVKRLNGGTNE